MPLQPETVLLVDDDAAVRNALKFALELEGMDVRVYGSGAELLAETDLPATGCLVVDYWMPEMDGAELVERLRRRHVDLPAILITARATEEVRRKAARSGVRQILEKPLDDGSLLDGIKGALAHPA